jgi:ubiquinol-cytochrome c reductase cytochrome b subunit
MTKAQQGNLDQATTPQSTVPNRSASWRCWLRTSTGVVLLLLLVQFVSGLMLAFYYVPSTDHAYATVSFIEKVLPSGSWFRALHHYGSQWLSLFVLVQVLELFWRGSYRSRVRPWLTAVCLLGLVLAAGATGYSLPWDARAFFSTRIAEGLVQRLPLIGSHARLWLLGSNEISTLTLSRFFALHVLVTPFMILLVVGWQLARRGLARPAATGVVDVEQASPLLDQPAAVMCGDHTPRPGAMNQIRRNLLVALAVFVLLALYASKFPAPLGPSVANTTTDYLPRPGAQFIWLYQTLKYVPAAIGSLVGVVLPGVALTLLAALPWVNRTPLNRVMKDPARTLGAIVLLSTLLLVTTMTIVSYAGDRGDPRTRQQFARQAAAEAAWRREPFVPVLVTDGSETPSTATPVSTQGGPPAAYTKLCAACHGEHGEGARQGPLKFPSLLGVSAKPRRSVDDIVGLLNDPTAYGLKPPMKSFATKLTDDEKRAIANWVATLK